MSRPVHVETRPARYVEHVTIGPHVLQTDEPREAGGTDAGPSPYELLLAALGSNKLSRFMNLRVADIHACYEKWRSRGAQFVTPPLDRGAEIRCYMRDPDGYLIEVGQSTGLRQGKLAKKRPEDLPGWAWCRTLMQIVARARAPARARFKRGAGRAYRSGRFPIERHVVARANVEALATTVPFK